MQSTSSPDLNNSEDGGIRADSPKRQPGHLLQEVQGLHVRGRPQVEVRHTESKADGCFAGCDGGDGDGHQDALQSAQGGKGILKGPGRGLFGRLRRW